MDIDEFKKSTVSILELLEKNGHGDKTVAQLIEELKQNAVDSYASNAEEKFHALAKESIASYKNTNKAFEHIAKDQAEQIANIKNNEHIDIDGLQEKFANIQEHMLSEVKRANSEIARLTEKVKLLEEESNLDPLTKVFNRRALQNYLKDVCNKGKLHHELHLLILDLDDFKQINDTYGHIAGDKILIFIAQILKKLLRDGDKIFRYGGEEFIVILNRITQENCEIISKRILQQISANKLIYQGDTINITVSIGTTKYKEGDTPESLISRADKALYEAKNSGKNRVVTL